MTRFSLASLRRRLYILFPLLSVLLCIGTINLINVLPAATPTRVSRAAATSQPVPAATATPPAQGERAVPGPPTATRPTITPSPTPTSTPTPTPTIPPDGTITLSGPPPEAIFALDDTLSFYWQWPYPLAEGHQLTLILISDGAEIRVASLPEPNFGSGYRWHATVNTMAEMDLGANSDTIKPIRWLIRLETMNQDVLLTSEERSLNLIAP